MKNSTVNTVAMVIWNAAVAAEVAGLINSGKSVPKEMALSAPKGFLSGLRRNRKEGLRQSGHLVIAQVEEQGYKLEKCDADWNGQTRQLTANRTRTNGDEVISLTLVKRATSAEQRQITAMEQEIAQLKAALAKVPAAK